MAWINKDSNSPYNTKIMEYVSMKILNLVIDS